MAQVLYFSGETKLGDVFPLDNKKFFLIGGTRSKHNSYDGYQRLAGKPEAAPAAFLPVTRKIFYKVNGSKHKCDARCQSAKGGNCECECGGKNHGIAA